MLDGGCNWRNRSELLGVLMRWGLQLLPYRLLPNTTGGSKICLGWLSALTNEQSVRRQDNDATGTSWCPPRRCRGLWAVVLKGACVGDSLFVVAAPICATKP